MSSNDFDGLLELYDSAEDAEFKAWCRGGLLRLWHGHEEKTADNAEFDDCLDLFVNPPCAADKSEHKQKLLSRYHARKAAAAAQLSEAATSLRPFRYGTEQSRAQFEDATNAVLEVYERSTSHAEIISLIDPLLEELRAFRKANPLLEELRAFRKANPVKYNNHDGGGGRVTLLKHLDVIVARGGEAYGNPGNANYLAFVEMLYPFYLQADKKGPEKSFWAECLRDLVLFRGGLFVTKTSHGQYLEVPAEARKLSAKLKQALRDRDEEKAAARKAHAIERREREEPHEFGAVPPASGWSIRSEDFARLMSKDDLELAGSSMLSAYDPAQQPSSMEIDAIKQSIVQTSLSWITDKMFSQLSLDGNVMATGAS